MNYKADELGNVYNENGQLIKANDNGCGYLIFSKYQNGKRKSEKVHRFVWEYFNGEIPEGYQIDHINHIPYDNRLDNLRIVKPHINTRRRPTNKLTLLKANIIRFLFKKELMTRTELANKYDVHYSTICRVINNKTWA